jgi:head-tail adaptor
VRIGDRRQRLTFEMPVSTDNGRLGQSVTYKRLATVWGSLVAMAAKETEDGDQPVSGIVHQWNVRYSDTMATFTAKGRIRWKGRAFEVTGAMNVDARNDELTGTAVEVSA